MDIPIDSVHSCVVSLCELHINAFLSKLNGLEMWATNVSKPILFFHGDTTELYEDD